ncbi:MAG: MBL fold metallo-hydrolase [Haloferacaceae archaeon]
MTLVRVTLLGTGAALATGDRVQTGLLVERSEPDSTVLLDCGSGVLHRLAGIGCEPASIDGVLLSHTHLDHVSDLPGLVKARWMAGDPTTPIVGPVGTRSDVAPLFEVDDQTDRVEVWEFEAGEFDAGGFDRRSVDRRGFDGGGLDREGVDGEGLPFETRAVSTAPTVHSRSGVAYRFGDRFAFSGDTEASVELLEFCDGVDVLVHDCARPPGGTEDNHPTPESLAASLGRADPDVDRLYLTHLYPAVASRAEEARRIVSSATDATVHVASDGDVVLA